MVTSGTLGQFQLVFQAKDVGDVLDGALDQVGINSSSSIYSDEQMCPPFISRSITFLTFAVPRSENKNRLRQTDEQMSLKSYLEPPLTAT